MRWHSGSSQRRFSEALWLSKWTWAAASAHRHSDQESREDMTVRKVSIRKTGHWSSSIELHSPNRLVSAHSYNPTIHSLRPLIVSTHTYNPIHSVITFTQSRDNNSSQNNILQLSCLTRDCLKDFLSLRRSDQTRHAPSLAAQCQTVMSQHFTWHQSSQLLSSGL